MDNEARIYLLIHMDYFPLSRTEENVKLLKILKQCGTMWPLQKDLKFIDRGVQSCCWKAASLQTTYGGRKATMNVWIFWLYHILSTEVRQNTCRCNLCFLWYPTILLNCVTKKALKKIKMVLVIKLQLVISLCVNVNFWPTFFTN